MCERAEAASYTVATSWTQPTGPAPWQRVGAHTWRSNDDDGDGGGVQQRQQQQQARQQPPAAASRALTWRRRLLEGAGLRLEGLHARTNLWVVALLGRGRRVVGRRVGLGVARSTLDVERLELQRAAGRLVDLRHDGTGLGGASIELCEPQVSVRGKPLRRHK